MNRILTLTVSLLVLPFSLPAGETTPPPAGLVKAADLGTDAQKFSYILGQDIGGYFERLQKQMEFKVDLDLFVKSLRDRMNGVKPLLTEKEIADMKRKRSEEMRKKREAERKLLAEKNKKEEEKFLAENAKKPGVMTTKSGLQYVVIKEGDGGKPKPTDQVKVNYKGTLLDGTEFDSSYKRGQPASFQLNRVIRGWTEGLQLMSVGSKYRFFIPSKLAYGERGRGATIGPNSLLIFDIELLDVMEPKLGPPTPSGARFRPKRLPGNAR